MTSRGAHDVALAEIERLTSSTADADDVLRGVLGVLHGLYGHAAIRFVENDVLVDGPSVGVATGDPVRVPVSYGDATVGELAVTGAEGEEAFLQKVAETISAHVLLGWDTAGDAWEP